MPSYNQYAVARRSIWYVLRTLLILVGIAVLCLTVFVTAMHVSSIYILVAEGLEQRAGVILQAGAVEELTEYFTEDFVALDAALYAGKYDDFTVTSFIYKLNVNSLFVLPWDSSATVRVTEKMLSITGTPNDNVPADAALPAWTPAKYAIKLRKISGRWYISDMILLEENPEEAPLPTPDYSKLEESPS